jgi:hypothetical protein
MVRTVKIVAEPVLLLGLGLRPGYLDTWLAARDVSCGQHNYRKPQTARIQMPWSLLDLVVVVVVATDGLLGVTPCS